MSYHNHRSPQPSSKTLLRACLVAAAAGVLLACSAPAEPPRFVDNGDGTVTDNETKLMWEKKEDCGAVELSNPHCVANTYTWSAGGADFTAPDGTLFTEFLSRINREDGVSPAGSSITRAAYTDWRVPTDAELQSILLTEKCPGSPTPCISEEIFGATQASRYWLAKPGTADSMFAWFVDFSSGEVTGGSKEEDDGHARAVRAAP